MAKARKPRRDYLTISAADAPSGTIDVLISHDRLIAVAKRSIGQINEAADGRKQPPWRDAVFLVFVNEERVAYNWRWEKCDPDDPTLPQNHAERFHKRLR